VGGGKKKRGILKSLPGTRKWNLLSPALILHKFMEERE
jgi:hypothetical protein